MENRPRSINRKASVETLEWEPWDRYFPGAPPTEGGFGGWVKVLHRPSENESGWSFLFKWVGWPGKTVRHIAVVPENSDEHVFSFAEVDGSVDAVARATYTYRSGGARHAGNFGADFTSILHYAGEPDVILSYEFIDR